MDAIWVGGSVLVGAVVGYMQGYQRGVNFSRDAWLAWVKAANRVTNGEHGKQIVEINKLIERDLKGE